MPPTAAMVSALLLVACGGGESSPSNPLGGNGGDGGDELIPDARWTQVSAGGLHSCGVTVDGVGYCWGQASSVHPPFGSFGTGDSPSTPQRIAGGHQWESVHAGDGGVHSCGITVGGEAYCWGEGTSGRLGNGTKDDEVEPRLVSGGHRWIDISTGGRHSCGITSEGDAYCWGSGPLGSSNNTVLEPTLVAGGAKWLFISAGQESACGIIADRRGACWGPDRSPVGRDLGRYAVEPVLIAGDHRWSEIDVGRGHACGITMDGEGFCWGADRMGQLGGSSNEPEEPVRVDGAFRWQSLSAGDIHTCGVTVEGTGYCWGDNEDGALGIGTVGGQESSPAAVVGGLTFATISAARTHTVAITSDGVAYQWGGGLAVGATFRVGDEDRPSPRPVPEPEGG